MPKTMSADHRAALALAREDARVIGAYLAAISTPGKRGRRRTLDSIDRQLTDLDKREIDTTDPLDRVLIRQRKRDLVAERERLVTPGPTVADLEDGFVERARAWAERKGISYAALREQGVPAGVLRRAGIAPR